MKRARTERVGSAALFLCANDRQSDLPAQPSSAPANGIPLLLLEALVPNDGVVKTTTMSRG